MYVRCSSCLRYARLRLDQMEEARPRLLCACGRVSRLVGLQSIGDAPRARFDRAMKLCRTKEVDLASAYSVLLGLMTIEDARGVALDRDNLARVHRPFDRGFRHAILEGTLTREQAAQRGDRIVYASKLVFRNALSMDAAFRVADNSITLGEALAPVAPPVDAKPTAGARWSILALVTFGVLLAPVVYWHEGVATGVPSQVGARPGSPPTGASLASAVTMATEIRTDAMGRPVRVTAATPQEVLRAFCRSEPRLIEPVRTIPAQDGWAGVYRKGGSLFRVPIFRDEATDRWYTGTGTAPIADGAVPAGRP